VRGSRRSAARRGALTRAQHNVARIEVGLALLALAAGLGGIYNLFFGYHGFDCTTDLASGVETCRDTRYIDDPGLGASIGLAVFILPPFLGIAWGAYGHAIQRKSFGFPVLCLGTFAAMFWGVVGAASFGAWVFPGAFIALLAVVAALTANLPAVTEPEDPA
jgi:hypothetical protein